MGAPVVAPHHTRPGTLPLVHHSQVIARAADNLAAGRINLHLDPLQAAARDLDCDDPDVLARARTAVAEQLTAARRHEVTPDDWTAGLTGWDSIQIAGLLAITATLNQPKELTP